MKAAVTSGWTPGKEDANPTGVERERVTDYRRVMKTEEILGGVHSTSTRKEVCI